ncbi:MAG TPA: asparagine synthase (glutamine-hydrolyzing) [Chitinophagales bacterium]|nr:asparagine synthase (glutamine-hydrolyzing) [Chitinophagales bacterium]
MCGIAGFYSNTSRFTRNDLDRMTLTLAHRGPDAAGYFFNGTTGLGHRRLSIIDLSERANQPMQSADGRHYIVLNGEIYNHQEIGAHLMTFSDRPFLPVTASDTEILLEAFIRFGPEVVNLLNGIFAFVVYDTLENEIFLFRDQLGVKPLFYYWNGTDLVFASELKAISSLSSVTKTIYEPAIAQFLHYGFIPAPNTIYQHIYKLEPATWLKVNAGGLQKKTYWNICDKITPAVVADKEEAMVKLSDLLVSAVQYQLNSDVPTGIFLSGGIDSSLLAAHAVALSGVKVNTFSFGFKDDKHNESSYAGAVARALQTDHHEYLFSFREVKSLILEMNQCFDEPFADTSAFPTLLLSKEAKRHITVALSGEGGDELFFGYGSHQWARRMNNPLIRKAGQWLVPMLARGSSRQQRVAHLLQNEGLDIPHLHDHIFSQEQYFFSLSELHALVTDKRYLSADDSGKVRPIEILNAIRKIKGRRLNAMEQQALFDVVCYLPDDLLTKVDRASMRYAIETRVPYLDYRVVEFALNLSPALKYKNGTSKYILREILNRYLPADLFKRPKQGFSIPLNYLLQNELAFLLDEFLTDAVIKRYHLVDAAKVAQMKREYRAGNNYLFNRLWLLIVLHQWMVSQDAGTLQRN